ncbi:MAG: VCBS repeat-containing protein [Opitutales bacterium]|nr:VCBS repeat-containing protein [Opitutales bacterium]
MNSLPVLLRSLGEIICVGHVFRRSLVLLAFAAVPGVFGDVFIEWAATEETPGYARSVFEGEVTATGTGAAEFFLFDVAPGDTYTFYLERLGASGSPNVRVLNPSGSVFVSGSGSGLPSGLTRIQAVTLDTPGSYTLSVHFTGSASAFRVLAQRFRGVQPEIEANGTEATATLLGLAGSGGAATHHAAGVVAPSGDIDFFDLGILSAGAEVAVTLVPGSGSPLAAEDFGVALRREGASEIVAESAGGLTHTVVEAGRHFLVVSSAAASLQADYFLAVSVTDATAPEVVSVDLPEEGLATTGLVGRITVAFDKAMDPATALDAANYSLTGAGEDGVFGTGDDVVFTLEPSFLNPETVRLNIAEGPLLAGDYAFTVNDSVSDRLGNALVAAFSRGFSVESLGTFIVEPFGNDSFATAVSIGLSEDAVFGSDLRFAHGRGLMRSTDELDFWRFTLDEPARIILALQTMSPHVTFSRVRVRLYDDAQSQISTFLTSTSGDQSQSNFDLPAGNYFVRIELHDSTWSGEYRFRVSAFPPGAQLESENNNTVNQANTLSFPFTGAVQTADVWGNIGIGDSNGDYFRLPNLGPETTVRLELVNPAHSGLVPRLRLYNGDGTLVVSGADGLDELEHTLGETSVPPYFARVEAVDGSAGLLAEYRLRVDLEDGTPPLVTGVTLPEGTSDALPNRFTVSFDEDMLPDSVNDAAAFEMRGQGGDGAWGTGADTLFTVSVVSAYTDGTSVALFLPDGPLPPDTYRFTADTVLRDRFGNALEAPFTREFTIIGVEPYTLETPDNNTLATATPLGPEGPELAADPVVPTLFAGAGRGYRADPDDVDYWSFAAEAGDRVQVLYQSQSTATFSRNRVQLLDPSGSQFFNGLAPTSGGVLQSQFIAAESGVFALRVVSHDSYFGEYRIRVSVVREPIQLEVENNNSAATGNEAQFADEAGVAVARIFGSLPPGDTSGDYFRIGSPGPGTELTLELAVPEASPLTPFLEIHPPVGPVVEGEPGQALLEYTVPDGATGAYAVRVRAHDGTLDLLSQYRLTIRLANVVPPEIVADTLPAEGSTFVGVYDRFSLTFTEDMDPATVNAAASYDLRAAGPDGAWDTADDEVYSVQPVAPYTAGTSVQLRVVDGPLQPGHYRFRGLDSLADTAGNTLEAVYERTFFVEGFPGVLLESRDNSSFAAADPLGPEILPEFSGSYARNGPTYDAPGRPWRMATGDLIGNGYPDLAVVTYSGSTLLLYPGQADGTFDEPLQWSTGSSPYDVVAVDLNGNGRLDLAVSHFSASYVSIYWNTGDPGNLFDRVDYPAETNQRQIAVGDLNQNGLPDLAVAAETTAQQVWFLFNDGEGGFTVTPFATDTRPRGVLLRDFDGDGIDDLVVSGVSPQALIHYRGLGGGAFSEEWSFEPDTNPYFLNAADLDGDGFDDLILAYQSGNRVSVFAGTPEGWGAPLEVPLGRNTSAYMVTVADVSGDGRPDLLAGGSASAGLTIHYNRSAPGSIAFAPPQDNPVAGTAYAGDVVTFGDAFPTLVIAGYTNDRIYTFPGLPRNDLEADAANPYLATAQAAGVMADADDLDYWAFTAEAGSTLVTTFETLSSPTFNRKRVRLYDSRGNQLMLHNDSTGSDQTQGPTTPLPHPGVYYLRVEDRDNNRDPYRLGVLLFAPGIQVEEESNNNIANANVVVFGDNRPANEARIGGVVVREDTAGDYFFIANLSAGTTVELLPVDTATSPLRPRMELRDASGAVLASATGGPLVWTSPGGFSDAVYLRVFDDAAFRGLEAAYIIDISVTSSAPPLVVDSSLPDAPTTALLRGFSLTFSGDMDPDTIADGGQYLLRRSADGVGFGPGDTLFAVVPQPYTGGPEAQYVFAEAPLPEGLYSLTVFTGLTDRWGLPLGASFTREFTVIERPFYTVEDWPGDSAETATRVQWAENVAGFYAGGGIGYLVESDETDYWIFDGEAGDHVLIDGVNPGAPTFSRHRGRLLAPSGSELFFVNSGTGGAFDPQALVLPETGDYILRVEPWDSFNGDYRFTVLRTHPPLQFEAEPNGTIETATPLTFESSGDDVFTASATGCVRTTADLDYFDLGVIEAGRTVFLSTQLPEGSPLLPVVDLFREDGSLVPRDSGSAAGAAAEVTVTATGNYFALVRASGTSAGPTSAYALDVVVAPSDFADFANLVVTEVAFTAPDPLLSGGDLGFTFTVANIGNTDIPAGGWIDRVVLASGPAFAAEAVFVLADVPRGTGLAAGASYTVEGTGRVPDGLAGAFYVGIHTDFGNVVDEFIFSGDNTGFSEDPLEVTLRVYPDLVVENLVAAPVEGTSQWQVSWNLANRWLGTAPAGHSQRLVVNRVDSGQAVANQLIPVEVALAPDETLPQSAVITTAQGGVYRVRVIADALGEVFEFNESGHLAAERNTFETTFSIDSFFTVDVAGAPAAGGSVTGGGVFALGATATVAATPETGALPYFFVRWTEGGGFVSAKAELSFTVTRDRSLVAEFGLPNYPVSTASSVAGGGTISGGGVYPHGDTVTLQANPAMGYLFEAWREDGVVVSEDNPYVFTLTGPRALTAVFAEANPEHVVTVGTDPAGIAVIDGAGTYGNNVTLTLSAPPSVVAGETEYVFQRFRLNGANFSTSPEISRLLTTADPPEMNFIARYQARSFLPVVTAASASRRSPVSSVPDYVITITFDRPMDGGVSPAGTLLSDDAESLAAIPPGGEWIGATRFRFPPAVIEAGDDGLYRLEVKDAADTQGRVMETAEVFTFTINTEPPPAVDLTLADYTETTAILSWTDYDAPPDLQSFRVYLEAEPFSALEGLDSVGARSRTRRDVTLADLELDTPYWAAVVGLDQAGNALGSVTPFAFTMASDLPDPVALTVSASAPDAAFLDWSSYPEGNYRGLAGYRVYWAEEPFSDVSASSVLTELSPGEQTLLVEGLERGSTRHFAVVAFNRLDAFDATVVSVPWRDPLSEVITDSLTLGPGVVEVLESLVVAEGADLTILAGTTLLFAPGTSLTIEEGRLLAQGTALDPVLLTSAAEGGGTTPLAGDWGHVVLADPARASVLEHTAVRFGEGLVVEGATPALGTVALVNNAVAGLAVGPGARVESTGLFIAENVLGVRVHSSGEAEITGSVIKNNATQVDIEGGAVNDFSGNWWGTSDSSAIADGWSGAVNGGGPLDSEPLLSAGVAVVGGAETTGSRNITLRLASLNAESFRVSENSIFTGAVFNEFPRDPWTDGVFLVGSADFPFRLSATGGVKTVFVQFRSLTGMLGDPVQVEIELITEGPVIDSFNLAEGIEISRPVDVAAEASAVLGLTSLRFQVNEADVLSSTTGWLAGRWDPRGLPGGIYRVRALATDAAGNEASREVNVVVAPTPPPAPVITSPVADTFLNVPTVPVSGTAEPGVTVRLTRNNALQGTVAAAPDGTFSFVEVALEEGRNTLVAAAVDSLGSTVSAPVDVFLDTGPPAPVVLEEPVYRPGAGLSLQWRYAEEGERAVAFAVVWDTAPFASAAAAANRSETVTHLSEILRGLADGTYWIAVVGLDQAGNESDLSNVVIVEYDGTAPAFTIAYDRTAPVGPGDLGITLTASEPLALTPSLTIRPAGMQAPVSVPLTAAGGLTYTATYAVTDLSARTGQAQVLVSARDLAGNVFNGAPQGPNLVFDVTRPTGIVNVGEPPPVRTAQPVALEVGLTLSKPAPAGSPPSLRFSPPQGDVLQIALTGQGPNWTGTLTLGPSQGDGIGSFLLETVDAAGNLGTSITAGADLELFTTEFPPPPGRPAGLTATTLKGGEIAVSWQPVEKAEVYNIYRTAGFTAEPPETLLVGGLTGTAFTDLPPEDGLWSYVVTASRRGAEGLPSGILEGLSDRTPPPPPVNVSAVLGDAGVSVTWQAPEGEVPALYHVYRNGTRIRTVQTSAGIVDSPPRGLLVYEVASVDAVGNEALSAPAEIEMFVDAVTGLEAIIETGGTARLTWESDDPSATGFNVYRNGTLLTPAPLSAPLFQDSAAPETAAFEYTVRAVNADGQQSAPRVVAVHPVEWTLLVNVDAAGDVVDPVIYYFDRYDVALANIDPTRALDISAFQLDRFPAAGDVVSHTRAVNLTAPPGGIAETALVLPTALVPDQPQNLRVRAVHEAAGGSRVLYETTAEVGDAVERTDMITLAPREVPLAGGLTDFGVTVHNLGLSSLDIVITRANGAEPGDFFISVLDVSGAEVARHYATGAISGLAVRPNGDGVLSVSPGASASFTVRNILVPEALGEGGEAAFTATAEVVYNAIGQPHQQVAGPLTGQVESSLVEAPYFGTSAASKDVYTNTEPVVITGQAVDRETGDPVPEVPLRIGIASGAHTWSVSVETDEDGNYVFEYLPPSGFSGRMRFWASHPDVVDRLDQTEIEYYRLFFNPALGDIVMSRADTLDFTLRVVNPGDLAITGIALESMAFIIDGDDNEIPVDTLSVDFAQTPPETLGARAQRNLRFRLTSTINAPDEALLSMKLTTAEGAEAEFLAQVSLRPAVPILSVTSPADGFVNVSVDRDGLVSRDVTLTNLGLRALEGVELIPPAEVPWFDVNLPRDSEDRIHLPDVPVGGNLTFSVVFTPPEDTDLGFFNDFLVIKGENAESDFEFGLFARVTSALSGDVEFIVDNLLLDPVPNASIRMRNNDLRAEVGPRTTDAEGRVLFEGLQEGEWFWQAGASGHSPRSGIVTVQADEVTPVEVTLDRALVTVNFTVVPRPFTDRYDIVIEQTFETRVPFPVLVIDPPSVFFDDVEPGFETTILSTFRNEGLIAMRNVDIRGMSIGHASLIPLITFIPELAPQEVVEVPMRFTIHGLPGSGGIDPAGLGSPGGRVKQCLRDVLVPGSAGDLATILNAVANSDVYSASGISRPVGASLIAGAELFSAATANPAILIGMIVGCASAAFTSPATGGRSSQSPGPGVNYSGGGFGCFPGDTPVETADGSFVPIADLSEGMWVRTGDGPRERARVLEHIEIRSDHLLHIDMVSVRDPDRRRSVSITGPHRVWTDHAGWLPALDLAPGDRLHGRDRAVYRIETIRREEGAFTVYNLELDRANSMYAGGILVQDQCGGWNLPSSPVLSQTPAAGNP